MAINEDVPGLEAFVSCQRQPMEELDDPNANDEAEDVDDGGACPTTIKYIECVDGVEFDVTVNVNENYMWGFRNHVLTAAVYVDGRYIHASVFRDAAWSKTRTVKGVESYSATTGQWFRRNFKFAPVKTIDDARKERVENDLKAAKGLGTIEVRFKREIEYGAGQSNGVSPGSRQLELAEKSLKGKAVSHGTLYGVPERVAAPSFIQTVPVQEDHGPILKIIFKYRSRDALKRELIIPRSPSLSPTLANLTPAERDRLAGERLRQLRSKDEVKLEGGRSLIKREHGELMDLTEARLPARPTKKSRLQGGKVVDVIDLTDD